MPKVRPAWLVLIAVIAITAGLPALRDQARLHWVTLPLPPASRPDRDDPTPREHDPIRDWIRGYRDRCIDFVNTRHHDDPEMLIAAAALIGPRDDAMPLLQRAVALDPSPAACAAYADALLRRGPWYDRVETSGVDPADAQAIADVERAIVARNLTTTLPPDEILPAREALKAWCAADPDNALPVALDVWCLYGLHQDAEALARWHEASRLPVVTARVTERVRFTRRLLTEMGMPAPEAVIAAPRIVQPPPLERLHLCASAVYHEGRRAQIAGRPDDAIRLWQASIDLGRHAQDSCETIAVFTAGVVLEAIGAAPVWTWRRDAPGGPRRGPASDGAFFYGPQHDLYLQHFGEEPTAELVSHLVQGRTRFRMLDNFATQSPAVQDYGRSAEFLIFGQLTAGFILAVLVVFLLFGTWSRTQADAATRIGPVGQLLAALPVLLVPAVAAGIILAVSPLFPVSPFLRPSVPILAAAVGASLLAALLLPLVAAIFSRQRPASLLTAWRGNLRRILPLTIAVASLLYLAIGIAAMHLRARWLDIWTQPGATEISQVASTFGPRWRRAAVPPGSFRFEYPPQRPPDRQ